MSTPAVKRKADQKDQKGNSTKKIRAAKESTSATKQAAKGPVQKSTPLRTSSKEHLQSTSTSEPQEQVSLGEEHEPSPLAAGTNQIKSPAVMQPPVKTGSSGVDDSEIITIEADVHSGPSVSEERITEVPPKSPQQLILDRLDMLSDTWESRFSNLNATLANTIQNTIQKVISTEVAKVRQEFKSEIDDLKHRVIALEEKEPVESTSCNPESTNIVIMGLIQGQNENVKNKVNAVLKEGLKLKDITVESAERKKSKNEGKPGIVIAKCKSKSDHDTVMKNKSKLNESRQYKSVRIERFKSIEQLRHEADLRLILQNSTAKDKLQVRGGHLVAKRPAQARNNDNR